VFAVNAVLLLLATLVLAFGPVTISAPIKLVQGIDLLIGLLLMLAANFLLIWRTLKPLEQLVARMRTADPLRPAERLPPGGGPPEVRNLVETFNDMMDRLEEERRESGRRALAAQEAERLRIARGLHDEVGQSLTGVLLLLDGLADAMPRGRQLELIEAREVVRSALEEVRRIAQSLRPEMLEHLGLVSALTELATSFARRTRVRVERRFPRDMPPLSPAVELAVFRVAQESLTNVARHADATRVELSLEHSADRVVLRIADDGRGLSEEASRDGGGLRGMRERAALVGGYLSIASRDRGVEVRFEAPAQEC
jgi:two-component system sensor histidine kinase UhpB